MCKKKSIPSSLVSLVLFILLFFRKSLEVAEDYNDVFYSSLMEDLEENFDEDAYLERLNRIG